MPAQATVPLEKAKRNEPTSRSIREALGIAYFRIRRWEEAEAEFRALVELDPVRRVRALRARPNARESGPPPGSDPAHQARALAAPAGGRRRHARVTVRAVVQRVAEASVSVGGEPVGSDRDRRRRAARRRRPRTRAPPRSAWRGRSPGFGSSRTRTGASTAPSSTSEERRSSSASSRSSPTVSARRELDRLLQGGASRGSRAPVRTVR